MRPALLLDVDGVLCPFPPEPMEDALRLDVPGFDGDLWVWIPHSMKDRLARLRETFDLVWATAWEDGANKILLEHFGLEPLPVIKFSSPAHPIPIDKCWKFPWISEWALDAGPFAWVDDDIDPGTVAWAEARSERGIPTLAIPIDCDVGLTDDHVETLEDWWSDPK